MRFCIWNVRTLYRSGSLTTVARELARYESDLVDIQEVGWNKRSTVKERDFILPMEKEMKIMNWDKFFCTTQNSISS